MKKEMYIEADDMYEMGSAWLDLKEYEKAEECLARALELNPGLIYAYIDLASVYAVREDYHRAIQVLKKGSRNDPDFDRLHYLMAGYAGQADDFRNALKYIDRAIAINTADEYILLREHLENKHRSRRR